MKLDVYVGTTVVGRLEQVDITSFVFTYAPGVTDAQAVSLLMLPSVKTSWEHRFLHPVFQVSLPEGALRQVLTRSFAKQFVNFGDTELLATVGSHLVGRIKITPQGAPVAQDGPEENLRALLQSSSEEMFQHYLATHAQFSGVSGGFSKFLAKSPVTPSSSVAHSPSPAPARDGEPAGEDDNPLAALGAGSRATLTFDHWIIKANDLDHPDLVLNEYFGMLLARRMNLPVPAFHLSDDCQRLAIRRFDFAESGEHLGFEDMCALIGFNAEQKFAGTVERVIKTINAFCGPKQASAAREQFYAQYLACMAIRNGDAHLKNFGLLYSNAHDVRMAPTYDMVSMSAYAPKKPNGDALDEPAMSFAGVRRWPDDKAVRALAARCTVGAARQAAVAMDLCSAMRTTADEVVDMATHRPEFAPMGKRMLQLWAKGIEVHDAQLAARIDALAEGIQTTQEIYVKRPRSRH